MVPIFYNINVIITLCHSYSCCLHLCYSTICVQVRLQIGEIPGSYNVFDMSDTRLRTSQSSLLPFRGAIFDLSEACQALNGNITLPDQFPDWICCRYWEHEYYSRIAGKSSHTFEPPSNPPSSYDSVSVAAVNVVGVGAARTCTTQDISKCPVK